MRFEKGIDKKNNAMSESLGLMGKCEYYEKRKILLYVLLFVSITLRGNVYFKHLGKTDGLSQISVISICQDELGRMWFGTLEGLSCYDGNSMTVYKPSQDSVRSFWGTT